VSPEVLKCMYMYWYCGRTLFAEGYRSDMDYGKVRAKSVCSLVNFVLSWYIFLSFFKC